MDRYDVVIPVSKMKLINNKLVPAGATKEAFKASLRLNKPNSNADQIWTPRDPEHVAKHFAG